MKSYVQSSVTKTLIDVLIGLCALLLAYQLRYEGNVPFPDSSQQFILLLPVAVLRLAAGLLLGLHRQRWRYLGLRDAVRIACASLAVMLVLLTVRVTASRSSLLFVPLGIIALQFLISLSGSICARVLWRYMCERANKSKRFGSGAVRNLLVLGAGFHGSTVAQEMAGSGGVHVVGFLDDDPAKIGKTIAGMPVIGPVDSVAEVVKSRQVDDLLVCLPPSARTSMNLSLMSGSANVRMRVIPSIRELVQQEMPTLRSRAGSTCSAPAITRSSIKAPFHDKKILITGGAGFIGSSLAERLVDENQLILFDQSFTNKPVEYSSLLGHPNVRAIQGDILNDNQLAEACEGVDMVVHTAAVLGVGKVCGASRETLETNYVGTSRLLKALEGNDRLERLIYFSTSEVFGVNSFRVDETTSPVVGPIAESRWSYAIAKLAGEHLVKSYYRELNMPVTIIRPFNVFGPRRNGDYALRRFILNALNGQALEVHGDGAQIRSWCFIDDFCDALVAMLSKPEAIGEDFNIGNSANTLTVLELARKVIDLSGSASSIKLVDHPFPDISIRVPSLTKAQSVLGYKPRFDLDSGLAITIDWYRQIENDTPNGKAFAVAAS